MARDFNGATDRIDWASVLNPTGQAQTFACWVYIDSLLTASKHFFNVNQAGDAAQALIFLITTGGVLELSFAGTTLLYRDSSTTVSTGQWYSIIYTFDGSANAAGIKYYINGVEALYGTGQNGAGALAGTGLWSIGGRSFNDTRNFDGKQDGVGVWNRVLTAAEIAALVAGCHPWMIRSGLVFAPKLAITGDCTDPVSGKTVTLDGTTAVAGPRLRYPGAVHNYAA